MRITPAIGHLAFPTGTGIPATEAEIAKTDAAVDRYMHAFEAGTLSADINRSHDPTRPLRDVALHGPGRVRKAVAQAFVHSLTVESRDRILPNSKSDADLPSNRPVNTTETSPKGPKGGVFAP